jgi:hypothetical protein
VAHFELPVATAPVAVAQAWHPHLERDAAHRFLRETARNAMVAVDRRGRGSGDGV